MSATRDTHVCDVSISPTGGVAVESSTAEKQRNAYVTECGWVEGK